MYTFAQVVAPAPPPGAPDAGHAPAEAGVSIFGPRTITGPGFEWRERGHSITEAGSYAFGDTDPCNGGSKLMVQLLLVASVANMLLQLVQLRRGH